MESDYLSYEEAVVLCCYYQYLSGAPINDMNSVDLVTIVPYDSVQQRQYIRRLLTDESGELNLPDIDSGGRYNVVLIAFYNGTDQEHLVKPLREYLSKLAALYGVAGYVDASTDFLNTIDFTHVLN